MPVFIYQPDALSLMAQVEGPTEGPEWIEHQSRMGSQSFHAFLNAWTAFDIQVPPERKSSEHFRDSYITVDHGGAIYGWWGWNRYAVRLNGEIVFIAGLSRSDECTERARRLGFEVMP